MSWGTLTMLIPKFLELGLIVKTRKIGRATLYKINTTNPVVKKLIELNNFLCFEQLDKIEKEYAPKNLEVSA